MESIGDVITAIIAAPFACIGWLIIGFIAGALARRIMGRPDRSFVLDIVLGLVGAVGGGMLASLFGFYRSDDGGLGRTLVTIVIATIGAVVLIALGNVISGRRVR